MTEPERDLEPKIYAPLLQQLETEHPTLAPLLIGVGDKPVEYDASKREVEARFQTEAGTLFSGKYHTEPGTADTDAKEFLVRMAGKFAGVSAADRKVLGETPKSAALSPLSPLSPEPQPLSAPVETDLDDSDEEDEDEDADDEEEGDEEEGDEEVASEKAAGDDWAEPKEPEPQ